jgi:hypothetical protein
MLAEVQRPIEGRRARFIALARALTFRHFCRSEMSGLRRRMESSIEAISRRRDTRASVRV